MTVAADYLLQMNGIVKSFGGVNALNGIDIKVKPGECVGLCGENGAGKIHLDEGALRRCTRTAPGRGKSSGRGSRSRPSPSAKPRAAGIVIIHQELTLVPDLSVAENIFMGHRTDPARWAHELPGDVAPRRGG